MNWKGFCILCLAFTVEAKKSGKKEEAKLKKESFEPADPSWLAYLTDIDPTDELTPIDTFKTDCDPNEFKFQGCHAALISPDLAVTNRDCLGRQQSRLKSLWIVQGMYDKGRYINVGSYRKVHGNVFFPPPKECHQGNEGTECMRNLVLLRFDAIPNVRPIEIPAAPMNIEDKRIKCKIYGWAKNASDSYQSVSSPALLTDTMFCSDIKPGSTIRKNDLCFANQKSNVCSNVSTYSIQMSKLFE